MRRLIQLALVVLGIRAFLRWRKSRHQASAAEPVSDPADDLRRKLAESREEEGVVDVEEPPAASIGDRRSQVHEQGRATLDAMKSSDES